MGYNTYEFNFSARETQIFLLVLFFTTVAFMLYMNHDIDVTVKKNSFLIKGIYGEEINYSDINKVDTISILPEIAFKSNGYSFGNFKRGYFKLAEKGTSLLLLNTRNSPIVLIQRKNNVPVYINFNKKEETLSLFNSLNREIRTK